MTEIRKLFQDYSLIGKDPLWGRGWDHHLLTPAQRTLILKARTQALAILADIPKTPENYGLIHCDFLPENLLVDSSGQIHLIDFDDSGFGYHLFDIATTLFWFLGEDSFDRICDEFLAGYRKNRALPEAQIELLPWFLFIRGLVYLGWGHTRSETEAAQELAPLVIEALEGLASQLVGIEECVELA